MDKKPSQEVGMETRIFHSLPCFSILIEEQRNLKVVQANAYLTPQQHVSCKITIKKIILRLYDYHHPDHDGACLDWLQEEVKTECRLLLSPGRLWPQTTNDALDVVCTQCYAGESDLKNSCTECWVQKTKPGYLDLNQQLPMHKGTSDPNHWCTGSCVQKTKRGYLIKWTVSYCTVWHTPCRHVRKITH